MTDPLITFITDMDACWLEGRLDDLGAYLATDVVFVAPNGARIEGVSGAIDSYRAFLLGTVVNDYEPRDHVVTRRGDTAIVEYDWFMSWTTGGADGEQDNMNGREILVLAQRDGEWRVVWRTQLPGPPRPRGIRAAVRIARKR